MFVKSALQEKAIEVRSALRSLADDHIWFERRFLAHLVARYEDERNAERATICAFPCGEIAVMSVKKVKPARRGKATFCEVHQESSSTTEIHDASFIYIPH